MRNGGANVGRVVSMGLCTGCGTCEAVCPERAITVAMDVRRGLLLPQIDSERCTGCGLCLQVCPGRAVPFAELEDAFLDGVSSDDRLGRYRTIFSGFARDPEVRHDASSGGLISALLIEAMRQGIVNGALVVGMSDRDPLRTTPYIAVTEEAVLGARGSKYCPSASNQELRDVLASEDGGPIAVVGLPCHVHGIRLLQRARPELRERIPLLLGLFCSGCPTQLGTEYFLRMRTIEPGDVARIGYRTGGWPGFLEVLLNDGRTRRFSKGVGERVGSRRAEYYSAFHYDFMTPRCLVCPDLVNELADISFGDLWLAEAVEKASSGQSFAIARTEAGEALVRRAEESGTVQAEALSLGEARRAQNYAYKLSVGSRIKLRRLTGHAVPDFGVRDLPSSLRGDLRALRYSVSYVSHVRWLWPAIRAFARIHYRQRGVIGAMKRIIAGLMRGLRSHSSGAGS